MNILRTIVALLAVCFLSGPASAATHGLAPSNPVLNACGTVSALQKWCTDQTGYTLFTASQPTTGTCAAGTSDGTCLIAVTNAVNASFTGSIASGVLTVSGGVAPSINDTLSGAGIPKTPAASVPYVLSAIDATHFNLTNATGLTIGAEAMTSSKGNDSTCVREAPPFFPFKSSDLATWTPAKPCLTQAKGAATVHSLTYQEVLLTGASVTGRTLTVGTASAPVINGMNLLGGGSSGFVNYQITGTPNGAGTYSVNVSQTSAPTALTPTGSSGATVDWFLTQKGTTFSEMIVGNNILLEGRNYNQPFLMATYGAGERPNMKRQGGNRNCLTAQANRGFNIALVGYRCYGNDLDPNSPDFNGFTVSADTGFANCGGGTTAATFIGEIVSGGFLRVSNNASLAVNQGVSDGGVNVPNFTVLQTVGTNGSNFSGTISGTTLTSATTITLTAGQTISDSGVNITGLVTVAAGGTGTSFTVSNPGAVAVGPQTMRPINQSTISNTGIAVASQTMTVKNATTICNISAVPTAVQATPTAYVANSNIITGPFASNIVSATSTSITLTGVPVAGIGSITTSSTGQTKVQLFTTNGSSGVSLLNGSLAIIEDMKIEYGGIGIQQVATGSQTAWPQTVILRRNSVTHAASSTNLFTSGNWIQGSNPYFLDENTFSYGGWDPNVWNYSGVARNHNIYIHDPASATNLRQNVFAYDAAENQWRDSGTAFNNTYLFQGASLSANVENNAANISYDVSLNASDPNYGYRVASCPSYPTTPCSSGNLLLIDGWTTTQLGAPSQMFNLSNPGSVSSVGGIATTAPGGVVTGFTSTVSGTTLTVTGAPANTFMKTGWMLGGLGRGYIVKQLTGTGGATCPHATCNLTTGTYQTSDTQITGPISSFSWIGPAHIAVQLPLTPGVRGDGVRTGDILKVSYAGSASMGYSINMAGLFIGCPLGLGPTACPTGYPVYSSVAVSAASPSVVTDPSARQINEPFSFPPAIVVISGANYGASVTGTMTWFGGGCTVNPVLNVSTSALGVINAITGIATAGTCSTQPPATGPGSTTWTPSGGLNAGSGFQAAYTTTNGTLPTGVSPSTATVGSCTGTIVNNPNTGLNVCTYYALANGTSYQFAATPGGAPINSTGTGGTGVLRTGSAIWSLAPTGTYFPSVWPNFPGVPPSVVPRDSVCLNQQTASGFAGKDGILGATGGCSTIQSIPASRNYVVSEDASTRSAMAAPDQGNILFKTPNSPLIPPARIGPNNILSNAIPLATNANANYIFSFNAFTSGIDASKNYVYNWNPGPSGVNTYPDVGYPGTNITGAAAQILDVNNSTEFPQANIEFYDAINNNGNTFSGTIAPNGFGASILTITSGSPAISTPLITGTTGDYIFDASGNDAVAQRTNVLYQIDATHYLVSKVQTISTPITMMYGSTDHFLAMSNAQSKDAGWNPVWSANGANHFIRQKMRCGDQTRYPGSPACPL